MTKRLVPLALALFFALAPFSFGQDAATTFKGKCAMCHGADGVAKAMAKGSRNFNDPAFTASVDEIGKVIMEGKGKMPKNEGKLKPEQAQAIAEHVKTLAPKK